MCAAKIFLCPTPLAAHIVPFYSYLDVRDQTAKLLFEMCHDVQVEPHLQSLTGEVLHYHSAVVEDSVADFSF